MTRLPPQPREGSMPMTVASVTIGIVICMYVLFSPLIHG